MYIRFKIFNYNTVVANAIRLTPVHFSHHMSQNLNTFSALFYVLIVYQKHLSL